MHQPQVYMCPLPLEPLSGLRGLFIYLFIYSNYHLHFYFFFTFLKKFVVNFVIHWNETAMGLHVFPIPIPTPTSLSTRSP